MTISWKFQTCQMTMLVTTHLNGHIHSQMIQKSHLVQTDHKVTMSHYLHMLAMLLGGK